MILRTCLSIEKGLGQDGVAGWRGKEDLRLPGHGLVRRRHTHVGAPDNRIEALYKEYVLTPRGKGHEPGTWTRGRRLTGKKAIISLWLRQRDF